MDLTMENQNQDLEDLMEKDEEEQAEAVAKASAFTNNIIMDNIGRYLSWKMLTSCRQVSKMFKTGFTPAWLAKGPSIILDFKDKDKLDYLNQQYASPTPDDQGSFNYNYKDFTITGFEISPEWIKDFSFLKSKGKFITKLQLHSCRFFQPEGFYQLVHCEFTKNLESIKFTKCDFSFINNTMDENDATAAAIHKIGSVKTVKSIDVEFLVSQIDFIFPWNRVLSKYLNLESIRISCYTLDQLDNLMEAIETIRKKDANAISLQHLNVADHGFSGEIDFPEPLLQYFKRTNGCSFNLKSLCFGISRTNTNPDSVVTLLKAVSHCLTNLKISHGFGGKSRSLRLPPMANLKFLKLYKFRLKNLHFLSQTPALQKLSIIEAGFYVDSTNLLETIENLDIALPSMTLFACDAVVHYSFYDICFLVEIMPNLVDLRIHLNNTSFRSVCWLLPRLKYLHVCNSKITDAGFTGLEWIQYPKSDDADDSIQLSDDDGQSTNTFNYSSHSSEPDDSSDSDADEEFKGGEADQNDDYDYALNLSDSEEENADAGEGNNGYRQYDAESSADDGEGGNNIIPDEEIPLRVETSYRKKMEADVKDCNYMREDQYRCKHNCKSLKDLEVLILERCRKLNGCTDLVTTTSITHAFEDMPKLKELWIEEGIMSRLGHVYASSVCPEYRRYNARDYDRPRFSD